MENIIYVSALNCDEKAYVVSTSPTLWFEAHILCQQNGMEMATVESFKEEEQLEIAIHKVGFQGSMWMCSVKVKVTLSQYWLQTVEGYLMDTGHQGSEENHHLN